MKLSVMCGLISLLLWGAAGCESFLRPRELREARHAAAVRYTDQAEERVASGDLQEALVLLHAALEQDPDHVNAHIGVGDIYQQQGDLNAAAAKYAQARSINPGRFDANYKLGLMYHLLNRVGEAIDIYLTALTINPDSFEANANLATAYLQVDRPAMGLPYAQKAVRLDPGSQAAQVNLGAIYAATGRYEDAVLAYRAAADRGELTPPIAINLVNALVKTGAYRAINTLNTLIRTDPRAPYYERLGYANFKLGNFDESLDAYQRTLDLNPDDPAALNGLGVNLMTRYIQAGREDTAVRDPAIDAWRRSLRLDSDQPRIIDLIARYRKL